jgi:hypothetical protein
LFYESARIFLVGIRRLVDYGFESNSYDMSAARRLAKLCFAYDCFIAIGYYRLYVKGGFDNGLNDTFFYCNRLFMPSFDILFVFPLNF